MAILNFAKPYIGVTGIMKPYEVAVLEDVWGKRGEAAMVLALITLVSNKTLAGVPNSHPNSFPAVLDALGNMSSEIDNGIENALHYYSPSDTEALIEELRMLNQTITLCQFDTIQLNMPWPDVAVWKFLTRDQQNLNRRIMQVGDAAMDVIGRTPLALVDALKPYRGYVTDLLLDFSGGTGQPLVWAQLLDYIDAVVQADLPFQLGIAGGLDAERLASFPELFSYRPRLSFDAQGRLRTAEDNLDLAKAIAYLKAAIKHAELWLS